MTVENTEICKKKIMSPYNYKLKIKRSSKEKDIWTKSEDSLVIVCNLHLESRLLTVDHN